MNHNEAYQLKKNGFLRPFLLLHLVSYKHDSEDDDKVCVEKREKKKILLV